MLGPLLRRTPPLIDCFAVTVLKFLLTFERDLSFHFGPGPPNSLASPASLRPRTTILLGALTPPSATLFLVYPAAYGDHTHTTLPLPGHCSLALHPHPCPFQGTPPGQRR